MAERALTGRVVLVTGAASGVGRGIALAAAAAGASVALAVRRPERADDVRAELEHRGDGKPIVVACDLTVPGTAARAVDETVSRLGRLDAVVHSAASNRSSVPVELEHADLDHWDEHRAIAVDAAFELARAGHGPLGETHGSMLLLTSPAGIAGSDRLPFYAMAKAAQRGFVKALAHEWGPDGIRVNALAPLAMSPAMQAAFEAEPTLEETLAGSIALGRLGDPEHDIGPAAVFLCRDDARYVTGQTLVVSGGRFTSL